MSRNYKFHTTFKYTHPSGYRMAYSDLQFYEGYDQETGGPNNYINPYGHDVWGTWAGFGREEEEEDPANDPDYIPFYRNGRLAGYVHKNNATDFILILAFTMEDENKDRKNEEKQREIDSRYSYTGLSATNGDPYGGILGGIYEASNNGGAPDIIDWSKGGRTQQILDWMRHIKSIDGDLSFTYPAEMESIKYGAAYRVGDIVKIQGATTAGDMGGGTWRNEIWGGGKVYVYFRRLPNAFIADGPSLFKDAEKIGRYQLYLWGAQSGNGKPPGLIGIHFTSKAQYLRAWSYINRQPTPHF